MFEAHFSLLILSFRLLILFYTNQFCPRTSLKKREAGCQFAKHKKNLAIALQRSDFVICSLFLNGIDLHQMLSFMKTAFRYVAEFIVVRKLLHHEVILFKMLS